VRFDPNCDSTKFSRALHRQTDTDRQTHQAASADGVREPAERAQRHSVGERHDAWAAAACKLVNKRSQLTGCVS
jgi:hypothetical protein